MVDDGGRVVVHMHNRRDNPRPGAPPIDLPSLTIYQYAGNGLWSAETDYWSLLDAATARHGYEAAAARFDPDHRRRRSRLHWPTHPSWAHP